MRKVLLVLAGLVVVIGLLGAAGAFVAPRALAAFYPVPENPVTFPHQLHVSAVGLECQFCHRLPDIGRAATVPALEQCMFCHKYVGLQNSRVQVVRTAWETGQPLNWIRQHRIPDHTQFTHEPHITAAVPCATCHGDVGSVAGQVQQVRPLKMGDCVGCHKQNSAPTQCAVCHY